MCPVFPNRPTRSARMHVRLVPGADIVSWAIAPGKRVLVVLLGLHVEPICLIRVTGSQRRLLPRP